MPLTQEHIGDALGLTNVHVNRMLRELREEGVLVLKGGVLRILDPGRLVALVGCDNGSIRAASLVGDIGSPHRTVRAGTAACVGHL